jgi:hypothetical protein
MIIIVSHYFNGLSSKGKGFEPVVLEDIRRFYSANKKLEMKTKIIWTDSTLF